MSRRRRPPQSRASCGVIAALLIVALLLAGALWRIYPEYQRLKQSHAKATVWEPRPRGDSVGSRSRPSTAQVAATLHFARVVDGKLRIAPVRRELPPGTGVARASLQELIEGPVPAGCQRPLPDGVKLRGLTVTDGLATADFTQQLVSQFRGGSDNEGVTVFAIVNTLTSLPGVERVQILVEGKPVSTIGGHLDISAPLKYDGELVMPES